MARLYQGPRARFEYNTDPGSTRLSPGELPLFVRPQGSIVEPWKAGVPVIPAALSWKVLGDTTGGRPLPTYCWLGVPSFLIGLRMGSALSEPESVRTDTCGTVEEAAAPWVSRAM